MPQAGARVWRSTLETVVWEMPGLAGEGAQGGPAGAVVEVVEGVDEVPVRTWRPGRVGEARSCHHPAAGPEISSRILLVVGGSTGLSDEGGNVAAGGRRA